MTLFSEIEKSPQSEIKPQRTLNNQKKKNGQNIQNWRHNTAWFSNIQKDVAIKIAWYWQKKKSMSVEQNGEPINEYVIFVNLLPLKGPGVHGRRLNSLKMVENTRNLYA